MKKYEFSLKSSREAIHQTTATNVEEATEFFAGIKNLPIKKFLEIYQVNEVKERKK